MIQISDKQEEMLAFIESFVRQNGYPPTHEEIRMGLNISTKSLVNYHLGALESAKLLARVPNTPRGIRIIRQNGAQKASPKKINSKQEKMTRLSDSEIVELTYGIVTNEKPLFALKIESETPWDSFSKGDIILLQSQNYAENGDLVAVRLRCQAEQTRFRRYYRENGHVRLQPTDITAETVIVPPETVEIQGKVVAVIRQIE